MSSQVCGPIVVEAVIGGLLVLFVFSAFYVTLYKALKDLRENPEDLPLHGEID